MYVLVRVSESHDSNNLKVRVRVLAGFWNEAKMT